jgi:sialidase-1
VQTDVFWEGMDSVHTYRIPAVVTTDNGTILAFAEARKTSSSDKTPTKLVVRRSLNGGTNWQACQTIRDDGNNALMDPCPVIDRTTDRIWLFHTRYPYGWDNDNPIAGLGLDSCTVWVTYSDDNGATWSTAQNITNSVKLADWTSYNIGPGVGIQKTIKAYIGRLIIPCSHGGGTVGNNHIIYSDDNGQSWHLGSAYISSGSESQAVELYNGGILVNIRNGGVFGRRYAKSLTGGASWSSIAYAPQLVEPVCQASILRFTTQSIDGRNRILFSNPASGCERVNMTVKMSYDECNTWPMAKKIHSGPAGYSCLTVLPDKQIGCLYECGTSYYYEKISFAMFSVQWLTDETDYIY